MYVLSRTSDGKGDAGDANDAGKKGKIFLLCGPRVVRISKHITDAGNNFETCKTPPCVTLSMIFCYPIQVEFMNKNIPSTPPCDPREIVEIPRAVWRLIEMQTACIARMEANERELRTGKRGAAPRYSGKSIYELRREAVFAIKQDENGIE